MIRSTLHHVRRLKNLAAHRRVISRLREIQAFETMSAGEKKTIQWSKLGRILNYARRNVPYYRERLAPEYPPQEQILSLPLLTKEHIRLAGNELRTEQPPRFEITNTSGGTTGEPVTLWQDENYIDWGEAYTEYYFMQAGGLVGGKRKLLRLWGSERDLLVQTKDIRGRIRNYVKNIRLLNSFRMTDRDISEYLDVINRFRPDVIEAYVHSLYEVTQYARRNGRHVESPSGIVVSAGCFEDYMEDSFRAIFPLAKIANRYGSREVGGIACSCNGREHLHVSMCSHFVEVVDDNGCCVPDGTTGNLVVTSLTNLAMPLIRFLIGDRGALRRSATCPTCGWQGDIITRVMGRTVDIFLGPDGSRVDGEFFTHLFYFRPWVKKFQVIQHRQGELQVNIVLQDKVAEIPGIDKEQITSDIRKVMQDAVVIWKCVSEIEYDKSGKLRYTISKLGNDAGGLFQPTTDICADAAAQ